jgi:hypothetical protein
MTNTNTSVNSNTPSSASMSSVAYKLMHDIMRAEGLDLDSADVDRRWVLGTYRTCMRMVRKAAEE